MATTQTDRKSGHAHGLTETGTYLVPINNVGNTATFAHPPTGNHP